MSMMISPAVKSVQRVSRSGSGTITISEVNPLKTVIIPAGGMGTGSQAIAGYQENWTLTNSTTVTYFNTLAAWVGVVAATVVEYY